MSSGGFGGENGGKGIKCLCRCRVRWGDRKGEVGDEVGELQSHVGEGEVER